MGWATRPRFFPAVLAAASPGTFRELYWVCRPFTVNGVAFQGSDALPVGSHVELWIDWPVRRAAHLIDLHATGFVVWSGSGETAVRITAYRFRVNSAGANHTDRPAR